MSTIVYRVVNLIGVRKRWIKERRSDKNARRYSKRYRRMWFWHEERWNQRRGV
jgi:hypothetical protein